MNDLKTKKGAKVYIRKTTLETSRRTLSMTMDSASAITLIRKKVLCGGTPSVQLKKGNVGTVLLEECGTLCSNIQGCEYIAYKFGSRQCWRSDATDSMCSNTDVATNNYFHLYRVHSSEKITHTLVADGKKCPSNQRADLGEYKSIKLCAEACEATRDCNQFSYGAYGNTLTKCYAEACLATSYVNDGTYSMYTLMKIEMTAGPSFIDGARSSSSGFESLDVTIHPSGKVRVHANGRANTIYGMLDLTNSMYSAASVSNQGSGVHLGIEKIQHY